MLRRLIFHDWDIHHSGTTASHLLRRTCRVEFAANAFALCLLDRSPSVRHGHPHRNPRDERESSPIRRTHGPHHPPCSPGTRSRPITPPVLPGPSSPTHLYRSTGDRRNFRIKLRLRLGPRRVNRWNLRVTEKNVSGQERPPWREMIGKLSPSTAPRAAPRLTAPRIASF